MAYKALYRTYRPQRFDEVVGQEVIVRALQNSLANGKVTHAYLFSGPRGTGKTTVARLLAKTLNCSCSMNNEPCNECTSCKEIMEGNNPDVIEIDAASNNGVDEIREIREKVKFLPGEAKYKVYIIDEVHMLTTSAFNALLKTLEEPPKHVIFILATTEPHKVLPTILSRCQRYDFKSLTVDEIKESILNVCKQENIKITEEAVVAIAESAEGGMRDALSFLDQAISLSDEEVTVEDVNSVTGNVSYDKIIELATCFQEKNISKALKIVNELLNLGKEVGKVVTSLMQFYRDILLYKNVDTSEFKKYIFEKQKFKELAEKCDEKRLFYYVEILSDTQNKLRLSTTPHIFLEVALIKMINVSDNDLDLIEKVKSLQEKVNELETRETVVVSGGDSVSVDNEKVKIVDEKINRVVSELGKLDLQKVIQKVNTLEVKISEKDKEASNHNYEKDIDKIKEELYLVKANYSSLQNSKENEVVAVDNHELEDKISKIEKMINQMVNENKELDYDEINDLISDRIRDARREVSIDYNKITTLLEEKVKDINLNGVKFNNSVDNDVVLRLENMEEKVYKIMSGALAMQPTPTKRHRNTVNENQIVLFGDDLVAMDNIEKRAVKERFDFAGLEKEESKKVEKQDDLFTVMKQEDEVKEEPIVFEKVVVPVKPKEEKVIQEPKQKTKVVNETPAEKALNRSVETLLQKEDKAYNAFGESKYDNSTPAESILNRSVETLSNRSDKEESKVDLYGYSRYENETPAEKILNRSVEKLGGDTEKPRSQLVVRRNGEDRVVSSTSVLFAGEKEELKKEIENYKNPDGIIVRDEPVVNKSEELDEFETYDVKVIERILNDSRKEDSKNDKVRIMNLWKNLSDRAPEERKGVAEVLQEGTVVAVGNREFIIIYSSASMCNQVMKRKFKRESLKLLFDFLGSTYNYMALPENVWLAKRTEYVNQYNIGAKNIHLQPINEPILNALMNEDDISPEEEMLERAQKLFGEDIIEYKE